MKILSPNQIKALDAFTIEKKHISSFQLMQEAAKLCASRIAAMTSKKIKICCIAGLGNNGGDAICIAYYLLEMGFDVELYSVDISENQSAENFESMHLFESKFGHEKVFTWSSRKWRPFGKFDLAIDGIFGVGLNKVLKSPYSGIIQDINESKIPVISIDIPSGLFANENNVDSIAVMASETLTFHAPKLSFMHPGNFKYVGDFEILDIGLDEEKSNSFEVKEYYVEGIDLLPIWKKRSKFQHKGDFGHALIIAGGAGKMGAAFLATKASLRTGAGLATAYVPKNGQTIIQTALPESMCITSDFDNEIGIFDNPNDYSAVAIGMGIGTDKEAENALNHLLKTIQKPLLIDADAINILAENPTWLHFLPKNCILTPHPKEFERIAGPWKDDCEKIEKLRKFTEKNQAIVVLKGAHTVCATPSGDLFFNSSGNPGMATAGSGDVLSGIIVSLLAQGFSTKHASIFGVYLHGAAGDLACETLAVNQLLAGDIIDFIPRVLKAHF